MAPALAYFFDHHGKEFALASSKSKSLHRERRGYMKWALGTIIQRAWKELKLHRREANIQPGNTASIELVKSLGFHNEGYSPCYLRLGGRWRDHERWAILSK